MVDEEIIKAEIEDGLKQVDENLVLDSLSCAEIGRGLEVQFTFKDGDSEMEVDVEWA